MAEKITWKFERSKIRPNLEDVELAVELNREELELLLEAHELEESDEVYSARISGTNPVREYSKLPFGYELVEPRENLLQRVRYSRDYIEKHLGLIGEMTPYAAKNMSEIKLRLDKIIEIG